MRSEIDQAQAAIEALEILVQVYARERTELTERLKGHLDANKDNLTQRLKEATEQHTKALGNEAQALRNFERQKDLDEDRGIQRLDGYSGTPYAQQRMDELDMRSAEARAKLTQEQTRRDALQRELTLIQRVNWRTLKITETGEPLVADCDSCRDRCGDPDLSSRQLQVYQSSGRAQGGLLLDVHESIDRRRGRAGLYQSNLQACSREIRPKH